MVIPSRRRTPPILLRAFARRSTVLLVSIEACLRAKEFTYRSELSATIGVTLLGAFAPVLPIGGALRFSLTQPAMAIESSMACRVFRALVLRPTSTLPGDESDGSLPLTTVVSQDPTEVSEC